MNNNIRFLYELTYIKKYVFERRTFRSEIIIGNWKPFKNDEKCF